MKNTNSSGLTASAVRNDRVRTMRLVRLAVIGAILGFLLPRATVYGGYTPFGLGLAAGVSGAATIPIFLCTVIGYLLNGQAGALRYLAALTAVMGLRWSVSGFPRVIRSPWFAPTITFISSLITGSAMLLTESRTLTDVVTVISESLLAAGFAYFCSSFYKEMSVEDRKNATEALPFGTLMMIAVSTMALFPLQWHAISAGRIVAVTCILFASHCGGMKGGSIAGCLFGIAAFLTDPLLLYLVPVYACGGLLSGFFAVKGCITSSLIFAAISSIVFATYSPEIDVAFIINLYEIAAATVFVFLIPTTVEQRIRAWLMPYAKEGDADQTREAVAEKMAMAAQTMEAVAGTVDSVSKQLSTVGAPSLGSLYVSAADMVCVNCRFRVTCWEQHFNDSMDSFNALTPKLNTGEPVEPADIRGYLKENCPRLPQWCERINASHQEYLIRSEVFHRLQELRGIINDQFQNTARILTEFSKQFAKPQWNDSATAQRLETRLKKEGFSVEKIVCRMRSDDRMEIELTVRETCDEESTETLHRLFESACGISFAAPSAEWDGTVTRLLFLEGQLFQTLIASAQSRCKGEKLCGDAFEIFRDTNGSQFVVLSDGMGCGGRAAVDGAMTAGLTTELLKAGFGYESILRIVNTALMVKSAEETLATLDIACIDLFTGDLELLKAGAGVSLLLSKGRVTCFDESSLPLGILRELTFARTKDRLTDGDILLLMSDGITNDGTRWIEEILRNFDDDREDLQVLVNRIVDAARKLHRDDKGDDMTVIAVKVEKAVF